VSVEAVGFSGEVALGEGMLGVRMLGEDAVTFRRWIDVWRSRAGG
jgi:hypothetical protein